MNPLAQFMSNMQPTPPIFNKLAMVNQAMRNPAAFVKKSFPDIPDQIANDPNAILNYLQQTRGITNQDLQNLYNTYGR